jgi:DNA-binding winged helix-turn-helix (wHTH) protein
MATKTSAVLDGAALGIPLAELTSGAPLSEWMTPPPSSNSSARYGRITHFEPDDYQIALVSLQDGQDRAGANPLQAGTIGRLFLLPLTWKEFVTRVHRALGHSNSLEENKIAQFGRVSIDFLSMEVRRSDRQVSLTAMEFKVLKFFVSNPNRVISREQLLNEVWGYDNYPCTRTVDNHVLKLRQKLESEPARPVHFRTVHGTGYKFIP